MDKNETPRTSRLWAIFTAMALTALAAGCVHLAPGGVSAGNRGAVFRYHGQAESVCVAGDFNGWSKHADCLGREGEDWSLALALEPGRYRYGLSFDGRAPVPDPAGTLLEEDGFGGQNSVLVVR